MGIIALLLLAALVFAGCGSGKKAENNKLKIAVTIVPEKAFVDAVCGDLAEVIVMVPPGYSPENFEPGPKLLAQFDKADLFFAIGVGTENAGLLTRAAEVKKLKVVRLQEAVAKVYPEIEVEPGERDEHIWLSPKRAEVMVEVIAREAGRADPGNQSAYERNARNYIVKLKELDRENQTVFGAGQEQEAYRFPPCLRLPGRRLRAGDARASRSMERGEAAAFAGADRPCEKRKH
jgi:zinc transport system substrate-binding protein